MIIWADSSAGSHTPVNQDSVFAELLHDQHLGRMVFAVVADGMGGMERGEVASATVVDHFAAWLATADWPALEPVWLWQQWAGVVERAHQALATYATSEDVVLGSTVTALLLAGGRYYILNLGDTRCYEVADGIRQLTEDHSLVAQEVRRGLLTDEQARMDARQNVLLQCLGAGPFIKPDFFSGEAARDGKYLICTDGMRHFVSDEEILEVLAGETASLNQVHQLIGLNRARGETDDISVVLVQNSPQGGTNQLEPAAQYGEKVPL
ncbi:MAG: serine/threonine-protein phosphatase [Bifidobacteriaceae bacterium]|jgi:serine/threonine protein phosphatase PrpC|nr:serine/threonine-protein phosphatase [Bifidobacteriaceae bacterium]